MKNIIIGLSCILLLSACVTREQADERLARGCAAAVEIFLDEGFSIKKIKKNTFKNSSAFGSDFRKVIISAVESDDWLDIDKEYSCIFAEKYGFLNSTHRASIYQVNVNDRTYGIKDGVIEGSMADHLKLTETVERAMTR